MFFLTDDGVETSDYRYEFYCTLYSVLLSLTALDGELVDWFAGFSFAVTEKSALQSIISGAAIPLSNYHLLRSVHSFCMLVLTTKKKSKKCVSHTQTDIINWLFNSFLLTYLYKITVTLNLKFDIDYFIY